MPKRNPKRVHITTPTEYIRAVRTALTDARLNNDTNAIKLLRDVLCGHFMYHKSASNLKLILHTSTRVRDLLSLHAQYMDKKKRRAQAKCQPDHEKRYPGLTAYLRRINPSIDINARIFHYTEGWRDLYEDVNSYFNYKTYITSDKERIRKRLSAKQ